jgi:hypothetical protein
MSRLVDRGAIVAAFVGVGMAVTMAISFLLIIPIDPIYILLAQPGGMVIGYYANARSRRTRGQWLRSLSNGFLAGAATGLTLATLLLGVKALFFFADTGFPDFNRVDQSGAQVGPTCQTGGDCVYQRYRAAKPEELAAAGVADAASFGDLYWSSQWATARLLLAGTTIAALLGAALFGVAGPRRDTAPSRSPAPA